jgi:putative hydrolase of the HAD superfamily
MQAKSVIFLDAVGTLFGIKGSVGHAYSAIASEFGVEVDHQKLDYLFGKAFVAAPRIAFPGAIPTQIPALEKAWWRNVAVEVFSQAAVIEQFTDFELFFQRLYDYFASADPWYIYPDTLPALNSWRSREIDLHIISNFDSRIYEVLDALELRSWFSTVTISTAVGAAKPDRLIFDHALAQAKCSADRAFHIGDSYREDYEGAIAAGIKAVLIDRDLKFTQDITKISQLNDFIVSLN